MAPSRKIYNNGRSPLVNKQHQITAFFTKSASPLLKSKPQSSPINPEKTHFVKPQNPNPNPNLNVSPNSSPPATPSPINPKSKPKSIIKPPLVIGSQKPSDSSPNSAKKLYGGEVVNRRIRVYWPLDAAWYEGRVKAFNTVSGKHLVEYDDDEEELIDMGKEKIEWIEEGGGGELGLSGERLKKRRRLRKVSIVDDEEGDEAGEGNVGPVEDDDSSDEDWGKNGVDIEDEDKCEEEVELEDEEEVGNLKRKKRESGVTGASKKRKDGDCIGEVADSSKKKKVGFVFGGFGSKPGKPISNGQGN